MLSHCNCLRLLKNCKPIAVASNCRHQHFSVASSLLQQPISEHDKKERKIKTRRRAGLLEWRENTTSHLSKPFLNLNYIENPENTAELAANIERRKGKGDIHRVVELIKELRSLGVDRSDPAYSQLRSEVDHEALKLPNLTHPDVKDLTEPRLARENGTKRDFGFAPRTMEDLAKHWRLIRNREFGKLSSRGAYYLQGDLALLEQALIHYTLDRLDAHGFKIVTVPDLVPADVINGCGVSTADDRSMVYTLDCNQNEPICLSGTAEMALAGLFANRHFIWRSLPIKVAAVSRCYRAEADGWSEESGLYRVHEFNKVEMFIICDASGVESECFLQEVVHIQELLFSSLGLHYQVLEMPPKDLAAAAFHKYDIEAWMPGRKMYGEISSASSCLDYQSRRLHITAPDRLTNPKKVTHLHTLNGTACAVPRILISIMEQNQQADKTVKLPEVLWPYMHGVKEINKKKCAPVERLQKNST